MRKFNLRIILIILLLLLSMTSSCYALEYELSDPDTLDYGDTETVVFINEDTVYIDGNFYRYTAYVDDRDWVSLSPQRAFYEWDSIEPREPSYFAENPHPEIPICVRTADGETFDSIAKAMYHILGYLINNETMPILVEFSYVKSENLWMVADEFDGDAEDVIAVSRGGTIVVSMDYGMLQEAYYGDPFFTSDPEVYTGEEAVRLAQSMLPEAEYQEFNEKYARTGEAEANAYVLSFVGNQGGSFRDSDLFMDTRLIGTKWITVTRPLESVGKTWDTFSNVNRMALRAKDGTLEVDITGWGGPDLTLTPTQLKNDQPDILVDQGSLHVEVFGLKNYFNESVYIAVIHDENGAEKPMWNVSFQIGDTQRNALEGYANGKDAVYCCILNDKEAQLLENGAEIHLFSESAKNGVN